MPIHRSFCRNVHFHDASNPTVVLGGLRQNGSVTEDDFIEMLSILLITDTPIVIRHRGSGHAVTKTVNQLPVGEYDISCDSRICVNDEPWVHRLIMHSVSGREDAFRKGIRTRDGRCAFTSIVNLRAGSGNWTGFEAAHIFPLESESYWIQKGYDQYITDMDDVTGNSKINSLQNGLLLSPNIHQEFDQYLLSVNPDDGYKIVVFSEDLYGMDGRTLDFVCRNPADPHRVSDRLLRWHFRQSVFANMRGAGEPIFEHDFPGGTDMIKEICEGPYAKERLEMEFAARLRGVVSR